MASTIPQAIIDWLKKEKDMRGWGVIWSLPLPYAQRQFQHSFERRVEAGAVAKDLQGRVEVEDFDLAYDLDSYQIDAFDFVVEKPSYNFPVFNLRVSLAGGAQVTTSAGKIASITTHRAVNPLRPLLELKVKIEDGMLYLDMRTADYRMNLGGGELAPTYGRQMAERMFQGIPSKLSTLQLARVLPNPSSPLLDPQRISLLTQATIDRQRQAILLFGRLGESGEGEPPVDGTGFPMLLAEDVEDGHTCTMLISRRAANQVAYGEAIRAVLEDAKWSYTYAEDGRITSMTSAQGQITIPPGAARLENVELELLAFEMPAGTGINALRVSFLASSIIQAWSPLCQITYRYRTVGSEDWEEVKRSAIAPLGIIFSLESDTDEERGRLEFVDEATARVSATLQEPPEVSTLIDYCLRRGFINALSERLSAKVVSGMLAILREEGGNALQPLEMNIPGHIAIQGPFAPTQQLQIEQQGVRLAPGEQFQFRTVSVQGDIHWQLQQLPGYSANMGEIDENSGLYEAPSAEVLKGNSQRFMVTALNSASGERHSSMVTLLGSTINVEPAFHVLHSGGVQGTRLEPIELKAHTLEAAKFAGQVKWQHRNIEGGAGGTLESNGETARFLPNAHSTDAYCSLDLIEAWVEDGQGRRIGLAASGVMFRRNKEPSIRIVPESEAVDGTLQLQAWISGRQVPVSWNLPLGGPGDIGPDGLYTADQDASDAVVLILASFTFEEVVYHGDLVLLLPLDRYAALRARLIEQVLAERDADLLAAGRPEQNGSST